MSGFLKKFFEGYPHLRGRLGHVLRSPARRRDGGGFTLIEVLVYLSFIGMILAATATLSFEMLATRARSQSSQECNRHARLAVSRLATEIRESGGFNSGDSVFGTNPGRISLATSNPATDPTVFSVSSGTLYVQQGAGPNLPITGSRVAVSEFLLSDLSVSPKVKIIGIRLKVSDTSGLSEYAADAVIETAAHIKKTDGFAN